MSNIIKGVLEYTSMFEHRRKSRAMTVSQEWLAGRFCKFVTQNGQPKIWSHAANRDARLDLELKLNIDFLTDSQNFLFTEDAPSEPVRVWSACEL